MDNLTPKQEKFVQGLVSGLSQRQAYIEAGYSSKSQSNATIDSNASRLLADSKVLTRYRDLIQEINSKAVWTREQSINERLWLLEEIRQSIIDDGVQRYNVNGFNNTLQGIDKLTFNDPYLQDEKLKLEIEKLKAEIEISNSPEQMTSMFLDNVMKMLRDEKTTDEDI